MKGYLIYSAMAYLVENALFSNIYIKTINSKYFFFTNAVFFGDPEI